jgi:N-acetylglucosaminyldiphosphoundecaprenol N-acetyl-beta-D-mannosaminyltransferase
MTRVAELTGRRRVQFAGVAFDAVTLDEAALACGRLLDGDQFAVVVTPNAEYVCLAQDDADFREVVEGAALVLADGISVVMATRLCGDPVPERCTGADLFPRLMREAARRRQRVFLLGGTDGSDRVAAERLRRELDLDVVTYAPPFGFERDTAESARIVEMMNASGASVISMHVGARKSEVWLWTHRAHLRARLGIGLGAAMDFYSGTRRRAPVMWQRLGLEWLHRLLSEPRRLWKRYTVGNARFVLLALREALRARLDATRSGAATTRAAHDTAPR